MSIIAEFLKLASAAVGLARAIVETVGALWCRDDEKYVPKHMARGRGGSAHKKEKGR